MIKYIAIIFISLFLLSCHQTKQKSTFDNLVPITKNNAEVTFIELGSVNCIPCRQMQPVMKAVEKKYGNQINVVFYDVWKPDQKHYAVEYKIKLIPTQVFLDKSGKEFFRHEGYFPETEIDKVLLRKGLRSSN